MRHRSFARFGRAPSSIRTLRPLQCAPLRSTLLNASRISNEIYEFSVLAKTLPYGMRRRRKKTGNR